MRNKLCSFCFAIVALLMLVTPAFAQVTRSAAAPIN